LTASYCAESEAYAPQKNVEKSRKMVAFFGENSYSNIGVVIAKKRCQRDTKDERHEGHNKHHRQKIKIKT
jgi:hypothetical protein